MIPMLASIIGETGNARLPKDKQFALSPIVPDRRDSPKGAYFKTPPLRRGWQDALMSGKATLRQLLDLSGDEHGRVLSMAYPDLGDVPVRFDPKSKANAYLPKTTLPAKDFTFVVDGKEFSGHLAPDSLPESVTLTQNNKDAVWTGLIHEALTHAVAEREGWSPDFKGTNIEAQGGDYDKYLKQAGERIAQAHVLYETLPEMRAYSFPELVERLNGDRGENPGPRSPPLVTEAKPPPPDDYAVEAPPPSTERAVRQDALGGDAGPKAAVSETPVSEAPQNSGGPRIVLNPAVFHDKRDALCVAMNEAIRIVCEMNGFEPVSEPTEKQRKFFADTAYADDELQLRRTILARIATLDTSVSDPTDEQLEETAEMLEMVMEVGAPQNEWEQQAVQRLHDVVVKARGGHMQNAEEPPPPQDGTSVQADVGGGVTDDETRFRANPDVPGIYIFDTRGQYDSWSLKDAPGKAGDVRWVSIADGKNPDSPTSVFKQTYGEHGWSGEAVASFDNNAEWDEIYKVFDEKLDKPAGYKLWDGGKDQTTRTTESALAGLANMESDSSPAVPPRQNDTGQPLTGVDAEETAELKRLSDMADLQVAEERKAKQFMGERGIDTTTTVPTVDEAMKAHERQVGQYAQTPAAQTFPSATPPPGGTKVEATPIVPSTPDASSVVDWAGAKGKFNGYRPGVVLGAGGRKTYTDAAGRRITKRAWEKLHGTV